MNPGWGYEEMPELEQTSHDCALNPNRSLDRNRENGGCHGFFSNLMTDGFEKNLQASPKFNIYTPTLAHEIANTRFSAHLHKLLIFNTLYLQLIFPRPSSHTSHCERWPFATRYMPNRGSTAYLSQHDSLAFVTRKMPNRKSATQKSQGDGSYEAQKSLFLPLSLSISSEKRVAVFHQKSGQPRQAPSPRRVKKKVGKAKTIVFCTTIIVAERIF